MKILLICPSKLPATGNVSTIQRIQKYLVSTGNECSVIDASSLSLDSASCSRKYLCELVSTENINGILFLHAFKAAKIVLCPCVGEKKPCCQSNSFPVPYGVIFGGTDLNLDVSDPAKYSTMQKVLTEAYFAVAFTDALKQRGLQLCPSLKIHVQSQGIEIPNARSIRRDPNDNFVESPNSTKARIFLMLTGIRPVKDPLYILDAWIKLCTDHKDFDIKLLILGPVLDEDYAAKFFQHLKYLELHSSLGSIDQTIAQRVDNSRQLYSWMNCDSVFPIMYLPPLSPESLGELLSSGDIFASINSSVSEGMASSILECMASKIPVIARDNEGNMALLKNNETGLLFHTPDDFARQVVRLVKEPEFRSTIIEKAFESVLKNHSTESECRFYNNICRGYFCT